MNRSFKINKLSHVSLLVSDIARALEFYCDFLGIPLDPARPGLGFPGAWLLVGEQSIHLLELPNPDPVAGRPAHGGHDRHVAFVMDDVAAWRQALQSKSIEYTCSHSGRTALFFRDPDGNALEFVEQ